jgi:hypothetical protein
LNQVSQHPPGPSRGVPPRPVYLGCLGSAVGASVALYGGAWLRFEYRIRFLPSTETLIDIEGLVWAMLAGALGLVTGIAWGVGISRALNAPPDRAGTPPGQWLFPLRGRWLRCLIWTLAWLAPTLIPTLALILHPPR